MGLSKLCKNAMNPMERPANLCYNEFAHAEGVKM